MRDTAASQLADVQKAHPDDLFNLLNRVVPFLRKKGWDTRISATKAIGGILDNAELWDPNKDDEPIKEEIKEESEVKVEVKEEFAKPKLTLKMENGSSHPEFLVPETFDVVAVIHNGKKLLGSSGKEYDFSLADLDPAERLAIQKRNVTARLGLGGEYMEEELVTETDFVPASTNSLPTPRIDTSMGGIPFRQPIQTVQSPAVHTPVHEAGPQTPMDETNGQVMSKRQLNMLKRKAKASAKNHANKVRVVDLATPSRRPSVVDLPAATPHPTAVKQENGNGDIQDYFSLSKTKTEDEGKIVAEFKGPQVVEPTIPTSVEHEWPLERLCDVLKVDMFDSDWGVRHGALLALREVMRSHGKGAGREVGKTRSENDALNKAWLDDLACRLCCIFILDKFGDYTSDTVST